jgi:ATP-dependent Clp protease ATP-binding subunit ClpC
LRRAVEHYLEDPLAEAILRGDIKDGDAVSVVRNGDKLEFKQRERSAPADTGVAT